ncbi:AAA family ATPase [Candidatus Undinarchaeota archaeon]
MKKYKKESRYKEFVTKVKKKGINIFKSTEEELIQQDMSRAEKFLMNPFEELRKTDDFFALPAMVKSVRIRNIGTIKDLKLDFKKGVNVIDGRNGTGKTTVLNAIAYAFDQPLGKYSPIKRSYEVDSTADSTVYVELYPNKTELDSKKIERNLKHEVCYNSVLVDEALGFLPMKDISKMMKYIKRRSSQSIITSRGMKWDKRKGYNVIKLPDMPKGIDNEDQRIVSNEDIIQLCTFLPNGNDVEFKVEGRVYRGKIDLKERTFTPTGKLAEYFELMGKAAPIKKEDENGLKIATIVDERLAHIFEEIVD